MTHTHPVLRDEVMAYVDGELSSSRASDVAGHLASCAECRAIADEFRVLSTRLGVWHVEPPPADFDHVRLSAAEVPVAPRVVFWSWLTSRARFGLPRWVLAAAPAAALVVVAISWGAQSERAHPAGTATDTLTLPETLANAAPAKASARERNEKLDGVGRQGALGNREAVLESKAAQEPVVDVPMIARTATLSLVAEKFDDMRAALERVTAAAKGSIGSLEVTGEPSNHRVIHAVLRIPANQLDAALAEIRRLGRVRQESLASEDIGDAHRDLVVRIANSKHEEARLNDLLSRQTPRLTDVLAVEREVTRVRGEIERMESSELSMRTRVTYSTISVQIDEVYRAELALNELPFSTRLRNAVVDGWRDAADGLVTALLSVLEVGPTWLVWIAILGLPAWWVSKRARPILARRTQISQRPRTGRSDQM